MISLVYTTLSKNLEHLLPIALTGQNNKLSQQGTSYQILAAASFFCNCMTVARGVLGGATPPTFRKLQYSEKLQVHSRKFGPGSSL